MAIEGLKLLTKIEEVEHYSHIAMQQFPKSEKYALALQIRETLSEIVHITIRCAKRYYKKTTLQDLDIEIEYLRTLIRKSYALKYINCHKYEVWSFQINEIGKITGGWLKTVK